MNENSYICRYAASHPGWREELAARGIQIKESSELAILNYGIVCDFSDPMVQEARGIIIDTVRLDVVCWPFRKFGNYGESYADDIDWTTARVQEKIDGSIVKLWHNRDHWQWSTNSMIDAADAHVMDGSCSFMDLIRRAEGYQDIPYDRLDAAKTYIFELVAPEQKIVIRYEYPKMYHIGTRSNATGAEYAEDIGIARPAEFPLYSLAECIHAAKVLNTEGDTVRHEGYVVVDADWHRIKVKSPEYVYAHRIASYHVFTKRRLLPLIRTGGEKLEELLMTAPDSEVYIRYYQWRWAVLKRETEVAVSKARALYEEMSHDRRAVAKAIKDEPLQSLCFKTLGNNMTTEELLGQMQDAAIYKLIPDYSSGEK